MLTPDQLRMLLDSVEYGQRALRHTLDGVRLEHERITGHRVNDGRCASCIVIWGAAEQNSAVLGNLIDLNREVHKPT